MNQSDIERLLEVSRRGGLTPRERGELEAWLIGHPEARPWWEEEAALDRVLAALPDAPLSPQFSRQVLAAVERFDLAASRLPRGWWPAALRSLFVGWRGAAIGAALLAVAIGVPSHQRAQARARLAESVAAMSALAEWPDLEALAEFEVVYHLPSGPLLNEADLAQAFE